MSRNLIPIPIPSYHRVLVSQCDNAKHSRNSVGPPCTSEVGLKRIKSLFLDHETNGLLEHSKMNYHDMVGGFNHLKKYERQWEG